VAATASVWEGQVAEMREIGRIIAAQKRSLVGVSIVSIINKLHWWQHFIIMKYL